MGGSTRRPLGLTESSQAHDLRLEAAFLEFLQKRVGLFWDVPFYQLLLGQTKLENTVQYLGIELDGALEISEQTQI
jgi:hypothetical protein